MVKKFILLLVITFISLGIMMLSGCDDEKKENVIEDTKKEYTRDEPYDFAESSGNATEDEAGSEILATKAPEAVGSVTPAPTEDNDQNSATVAPTAKPAPTPNQEASLEDSSENSSENSSPDSTVNAGTEEVEDKSFNDIADENKVPEEVVMTMTTKALMETYMRYPMIKLLIFELDPIKSYEQWLANDDMCVNQLIERKDAVAVIIAKYKELIKNEKTEHLSLDSDSDLEFEIDWVELLLLQDKVKEKATLAQQKEIRDLAIKRDENVLSNGYAVTDLYPSLAEKYKLG